MDIIISAILFVLSIIVSACRHAIDALPLVELKQSDSKKKSIKSVHDLMHDSKKIAATMQVVYVTVNVAFVILASYTIFSHFADVSVPILFVFITLALVLLLLLSETIPKKYAAKYAIDILSRFSIVLRVLQILFYPLIITVLHFNINSNKQQDALIEDLGLSEALENNSDISKNMAKNIFKYADIDVHTIMRPRMDVKSVDITSKLSDIIHNINEWGYSRIPVYEGTRDNIKGILYVRDLLPYITENNDFHWQELIREACIVTEDKKIDDLLKIFQKIKNHMAIIVDVNVGMVGIVTLEDILEEIVGEIDDESDDVEQDYTKIDDRTYIFEGKVLLHDFFRIMDLNKSDFEQVMGEAETLAGMILEIKGELPQMGDCIDFMDLSFCTESVEKRRIKQIKVTINDKNVSKI